MTQATHIRHGFGAVRPYLYGHPSLEGFVQTVFGAEPLERHEFPNGGVHWEGRIGDAALVIELMEAPPPGRHASIYVYVPDVDAAYAAALAAGAASLSEPADKPYQERACGVRDVSGNTWYIATATA